MFLSNLKNSFFSLLDLLALGRSMFNAQTIFFFFAVFYFLFLHHKTTFLGREGGVVVSIVEFEQVNVSWKTKTE